MMSTLQQVDATTGSTGPGSRTKTSAGAVSAVLLSLVFLASGIWKITDLEGTSERVVQLLIPAPLALATAAAAAIAETFAGVLLVIPRFRRWGAWLAGLMLAAFMVYFAVFYQRLLGEDCSCFPWVERVVGPAFFIGDAVMLVLALVAGRWSQPSHGLRRAAVVLGCLCLAAAGSYAVSTIQRRGVDVPEATVVDGHPVSLRRGRLLLYFFDPECMHCYQVAQNMSRWNWGATRLVALPVQRQQFARFFLRDTGLQAGVSPDAAALRKIISFTDAPYAVALDRGRVVATFNSGQMELDSYRQALEKLGHIKGGGPLRR